MSRAFHIFLICVAMLSCSAHQRELPIKFNGVNLVSTSKVQDSSFCIPLQDNGVNSIAIVPFAYGNSTTGKLIIETEWQWWGESLKGSKELARIAKSQGFQVMIKPQVWFDWGTYTGDVDLITEAKWLRFEKGYSDYILQHAKNAQEVKADIFCIGTELKSFVLNRPAFWNELIQKVRQIYSGKLTYAGNWDSYKLMPFWGELDFIGVDAYFPVCDQLTPGSESVASGWQPYIDQLENISKEFEKKIIFCEFGYRSVNYCALKPWETSKGGELNLLAQHQAYEGFFNSVWKQEFMAGGFLWKWYPDHKEAGGNSNDRFTPQNKPALEVIKKHFSSTS